ncbi:glycosyltransferase family 4 protein [Spirochaeta africana]|uniref:Glycosyltransferase n=1 Tax=Spirochaeta africana (strain ATCC 700263 / DSM 8902 / Z-7692) TaxID=889378 RepID=H9UF65_SPIAZ|nr:glycosyltransferase family 4 protein [Spirochaeta africana]AFG36158.1 glycosyltransferase [Spirochaeta africana DSM 8902]
MNILFFSTKSSYSSRKVGGAEMSMRLMAETFAQSGCDVAYVTTSESRILRWDERQVNGVRVLFMPSFRNGCLSFLPLWITSKLDMLFRRLYSVRQHVQLDDVQAIYCFYQLRPLMWFLKNRTRYGYRVIMRMAGLDWLEEIAKKPWKKPLYQRSFNSVDSINYTSHGLYLLSQEKAQEISFELQPSDSFVQDIGIRLEAQEVHTQSEFLAGKLRVVVATRFSDYQKRQDILVYAVKALKDTGQISTKNFSMLLIGSGVNRTAIQQLIYDLDVQELCTIQGFMPQYELWQVLQAADVLCHPCEYEGLAKIVAESMVIGLPVIASKVPPFTDIIEQGENGYLCNNDPTSWSAALAYLMDNPESRRKVSAQARSYALEHYNPEVNARKYLREFSRVCEQT